VKALDPDPVETEQACRRLGAPGPHLLPQRDTYFRAGSGRLKLREHLADGTAELIGYERPTSDGVRASRYRRVPVSDTHALRDLLGASLGVEGVVEKERRLYLYENVRIHLDDVAGLGTYLELEAVLASPAGEATDVERAAMAKVEDALHVSERETVAGSYLDLLLAGAASSGER
jgi:predicted adenylyl cyclase CyaB